MREVRRRKNSCEKNPITLPLVHVCRVKKEEKKGEKENTNFDIRKTIAVSCNITSLFITNQIEERGQSVLLHSKNTVTHQNCKNKTCITFW